MLNLLVLSSWLKWLRSSGWWNCHYENCRITHKKILPEHLQYIDRTRCSLYEINESEKRDKRAKCVKAKGNGTLYLMNNLNDVMSLLAIAGTSSARTEPGNCVIILFFTKFCPGCQALVPHWNALARNFVDIKVSSWMFKDTQKNLQIDIIVGRSNWRIGTSRTQHWFRHHRTPFYRSLPPRPNGSKIQHLNSSNGHKCHKIHWNTHKPQTDFTLRRCNIRWLQPNESIEGDNAGGNIRRLFASLLDLHHRLRSLLLHQITNFPSNRGNDQSNLEGIKRSAAAVNVQNSGS